MTLKRTGNGIWKRICRGSSLFSNKHGVLKIHRENTSRVKSKKWENPEGKQGKRGVRGNTFIIQRLPPSPFRDLGEHPERGVLGRRKR